MDITRHRQKPLDYTHYELKKSLCSKDTSRQSFGLRGL